MTATTPATYFERLSSIEESVYILTVSLSSPGLFVGIWYGEGGQDGINMPQSPNLH